MQDLPVIVSYRSSHGKMLPDILHNPTNVFAPLQETKALGEGDFANDIKGEHLQPIVEGTDLTRLDEALVHLLEEDANRRVDI